MEADEQIDHLEDAIQLALDAEVIELVLDMYVGASKPRETQVSASAFSQSNAIAFGKSARIRTSQQS